MAFIKKLVHRRREDIDSRIEEYKLKQCVMFANRGFMVTVLDSDGNIVFSPYMVSNFSIDGNKIFITVYDLIQNINIEEKLDELCKGFWLFKPQLSIALMRLDSENKEVYRVRYEKCKLRKYHGKNFTYKGSEPHQWYLELSFSKKEIIKNEKFDFSNDSKVDNVPTQEELDNPFMINNEYPYRHKRIVKKEVAILKNSNKMLDEAAEHIKDTNRLTPYEKKKKLNEINKAKKENDKAVSKIVKVSQKSAQDIEKELVSKISELEDNINI